MATHPSVLAWRIPGMGQPGPWTARRLNQSILKEINPEYSLEGLDAEVPVLWPPDVKSGLIGKDRDAGKD